MGGGVLGPILSQEHELNESLIHRNSTYRKDRQEPSAAGLGTRPCVAAGQEEGSLPASSASININSIEVSIVIQSQITPQQTNNHIYREDELRLTFPLRPCGHLRGHHLRGARDRGRRGSRRRCLLRVPGLAFPFLVLDNGAPGGLGGFGRYECACFRWW